ncbi:MAG: AAA family ATPase, partial [Planctomycetaceae bacterium]|nr:AAA family ATPase [Planctomycetaceae bacterium]
VSSSGHRFRDQKVPNGDVLICNSEDDYSRTIKKRLRLNRAEMEHVYTCPLITREVTKKGRKTEYEDTISMDNIVDLRETLKLLPNCRLIIFDPISAYWGEVNENKNPEVRCVMAELKDVAEKFNLSIVLVTHYNKALGCHAMQRVTGSNALIAASRAAWSVTYEKATNTRIVANIKMNIAEDRRGFAFNIIEGEINVLDEYLDVTADEMLMSKMNGQSGRGRPPKQSNAAMEWLAEFLKDGAKFAGNEKNPKPGTICYEAEKAGFDFNTINNRISLNMGIKKKKTKNGHIWRLPTSAEFATSAKFKSNSAEVVTPENTISYSATSATSAKFTEGIDELEKQPESDEIIISKTKAEMQERVKQIKKSKQEREKRIKQQAEENLKKMESLKNTVVCKEPQEQTTNEIKSLP